ncbi:glycosyltransferase family 4 protein [Cellulomonas sp. P22]|uniref:glycosyltransferase family 4 protein n=1 Tax=Cellulomonas sp. P22 TaxID=3373189 RepID=UPI0037AE7FD4
MSPGTEVVHVVCTEAFAGVERYVATLARVQDAQGSRVRVLGGDGPRMRAELAGSGVHWSPAGTPWQAAHALTRLRDVRVVHAHMTAAETAAVLAARAPVVATRHFASTRGSSTPARAVGRLVSARIAGQVAISAYVAARVEGASTVIHPGVPDQAVTSSGRRPVVLVAQRLEAEKRTDLALRIWAASGLAGRGWRLQVAGSGARLAELRDLAEALDVSASCDFLGARTDVGRLMAHAAIFLAPRPDEPYGLSVVEAMAHATPVVASDGGGHVETVGLCPDAVLVRAEAVAEAGGQLAALAADATRRAGYGAALRELQRRLFTVEAHASRLEEVYRGVVARGRGAAPVPDGAR